eukprot:maker-scaffold_23-snap-gene-3.43-mRNA-1 protein AED:0.13 eAED:0.13 QI:47/0.83/1/1/0.66/0.42/7/100/242
MMNSIQQKYEERQNKTEFIIEWGEYRGNLNQFKREMEEFVKGFQLSKEVSFIVFRDCPFYAVESIFTRFIFCFPAVKALHFVNCRFSDENFQNFQQLKILKLNITEFHQCNIPEVSSFCSLLSSINTEYIRIEEDVRNKSIVSAIKNYLKAIKRIGRLVYRHTELSKKIEEDVQNKAIVSAIKNYLKANKRIERLRYEHTERSKKIEEEDIIELQEIVDSHPSILSLTVYESCIKPKGKIKC